MRRNFVAGGNHPEDLTAVVLLLRTFWDWELVREPVRQWRIGEHYLDDLQALAQEIRDARRALPRVDDALVHGWLSRIDKLHADMQPGILAFDASLGHTARHVVQLLLWANGLLVPCMVLFAFWRADYLLQAQKAIEDALATEREGAQLTLGAISEGVLALDKDGNVAYMNPAAKRLLGVRFRDIRQKSPHEWVRLDPSAHDESYASRLFAETPRGELPDELRQPVRILHPDGTFKNIQFSRSPLRRNGEQVGAALVLRDVTQEQRLLEELAWQAGHDELTGLPNRREFERRLEALLAQRNAADASASDPVLLYIDLDQFKVINDTSGHQAGDALLRKLASVIQANIRTGDLLARLGGDEFGVLIQPAPEMEVMHLVEQLRQKAQDTRLQWEGQELTCTLSIGLVPLRQKLRTAREVLRAADVACYRAKELGRNRVYLYSSDDATLLQQLGRMEWVQRLRKAQEENRFLLYAQSIMPLHADEGGLHFEVLMRLRDPDGKIVPPGSFLPAAEIYGLMSEMDRWVVRQCFKLLAEQKKRPGAPKVHTCSINLSGVSLSDESLLGFILEQFEQFATDPRQVCFEITETSAIAHLPSAQRMIDRLRQIGCRFSLDDFGSGMSSFGYLRQLRVDYLKIDGSFVRDMVQDRASAAMVDAINRIGHVLGQRTIAEFVETPGHVQALRALGVDYAQGYAVAKPRPIEEVLAEQEAAVPA